MRLRDKSKICAWLILLVYVPVVLLSLAHIHRVTPLPSVDCDSCTETMSHTAHVSPLPLSDTDDCVFCRFFSLTYVAAPVIVLAVTCLLLSAIAFITTGCLPTMMSASGSRDPPCYYSGFYH